jgi:hypothetical protein
MRLFELLTRLGNDEDGATLLEYTVLIAIMLVADWACPGFVERSGLGIRVSGLTAFCPPL